jgi:diphthine-ammonia ligase
LAIKAFSSWSGGKDSALALYRAGGDGYAVQALLTMMAAEPGAGGRSRSHGLSQVLLERQSLAMGLEHVFGCATWEGYEAEFIHVVGELKRNGFDAGVFGDIDLQAHLDWVARVCGECDIKWHEPLWQFKRRRVVEEFLAAGFKAIIVSCDSVKMGEEYLGRQLTLEIADQQHAIDVDPAGENGEYHTFVYDGPMFSRPVEFTAGDVAGNNGYVFLEIM